MLLHVTSQAKDDGQQNFSPVACIMVVGVLVLLKQALCMDVIVMPVLRRRRCTIKPPNRGQVQYQHLWQNADNALQDVLQRLWLLATWCVTSNVGSARTSVP